MFITSIAGTSAVPAVTPAVVANQGQNLGLLLDLGLLLTIPTILTMMTILTILTIMNQGHRGHRDHQGRQGRQGHQGHQDPQHHLEVPNKTLWLDYL